MTKIAKILLVTIISILLSGVLISYPLDTVSADPGWLAGYDYRKEITITEDGGGAKSDYVIPIEVEYGSTASPLADDGIITSSVASPCPVADYYSGTYNRTYQGYYTSDGYIKIHYYDEDTGAMSDPITLWSSWGWDSNGVAIGDDHASPSVIILRYQTGDNSIHNGKILTAAAEHSCGTSNKGRLETRRSTYAEFDNGGTPNTSFDSAVSIRTTLSNMAHLVELDDGTIFLFSRLSSVAPRATVTWYAWTSSDAGTSWTAYNSGNPLWDAPVGETDGYYTMVFPDYDNAGIHVLINTIQNNDPAPGYIRYDDIYYLFYNHDDGKWYHADGETEFTLGSSQNSMDLVYDTDTTEDEEDWTFLWDIKCTAVGVPYLIFINYADASAPFTVNLTGEVYRANYSGSWVVEEVAKSGQFGTYTYPAGAVLDPMNMDIVYATPYKPSTTSNTELEKYQRISGNWTKVADIAASDDGDYFRPVAVRYAPTENDLRIIYCYTERYEYFEAGDWDSSILTYPLELSTGLGGHCRTDFGDIRFTASDGVTLQPSASDGKPWIETKTNGDSAQLWVKVGNVPASGDLDIYMYWGNSGATNENDQDVMDAQFPECDLFTGSSLDTDKWYVRAGDVTVNDGNLVLTGTTGTRGLIEYKATYTAPCEVRMRFQFSSTSLGTAHLGGTKANWDEYDTFRLLSSITANYIGFQTVDDAAGTQTNIADMDVTNWHEWYMQWLSSSSVKAYQDDVEKASHTTNIPTGPFALYFREGTVAATYVYVDWVFMRPLTNPEPEVTWGTEEEPECSPSISLNTYSWSVNGGSPVSENSNYSSGLTYFTITNNSGGAVSITIGGTDMTGGGYTWDLADDGSPGDMVYGLYAGLEGGSYNIIVRETATYNTLKAGLADEGTQSFGLKIYTPTDYDDGNEKSGTITLTVVCD